MPRLHVNIDHVATVRQQRGTIYPDPVAAAALCELAGAEGITAHLREDRRHIQDRDIRLLRQTVRGTFNLEMAATPEMVDLALNVKPDLCTLVPERREERTTEGGLSVAGEQEGLRQAIDALQGAGIDVSLFIDPDPTAVEASRALGVHLVELHTGDYCHASAHSPNADRELGRLTEASQSAVDCGLKLAAGHGLDYLNVGPVAALPGLAELNIGHGIVARALFMGMTESVKEMRAAIAAGGQSAATAGAPV